ncbi:MAG: transcription termination/antitermination protein NusA [Gammaproteobacteria bacterium]|nr:transcription termination/antitermination protein NusA [Gammaproteobacteria bacterium]
MGFKEVKSAVESIANEKGIQENVVFDAIESALSVATKRRHGADKEFRVAIDWENDAQLTYRVWHVVDPDDMPFYAVEEQTNGEETEERIPFNSDLHLTLAEAHERSPDLEIGHTWEEPHENVNMGRIVAQISKQVINQEVRRAERERIVAEYRPKIGELVTGKVSRFLVNNKTKETRSVILELPQLAEGRLDREHLIPMGDGKREILHKEDQVKAFLVDVTAEDRGQNLILSRTHDEMLVELFKREIPEVHEDVIKIRGVARSPGRRAKVAVSTNDQRIDAVGSCVGIKGSRIQSISSEICGEKIDVFLWAEDPAELVLNAMAPAQIQRIEINEENHSMDLIVEEHQSGSAIGEHGMNVRLASELTGWTLKVVSREKYDEKVARQENYTINRFVSSLEIENKIAKELFEAGYVNLEQISESSAEILAEYSRSLEAEAAQEIIDKAGDVLMDEVLTGETKEGSAVPADDLRYMAGMDDVLASQLASNGVVTMEDLAELSIDELLDIDESMDEKRAGDLIITARKPWFEDDEADEAA